MEQLVAKYADRMIRAGVCREPIVAGLDHELAFSRQGAETEVMGSPAEQEHALALQQVLRDLPAEDRALLRSRYVEGASYSELSRRLQTSRSAIYRRVDRLMREIRARARDSWI